MPKSKQEKREEAAVRNAAYKALSTDEKLRRLSLRHGEAKRERERLAQADPLVRPATATPETLLRQTAKVKGMKLMPDGSLRPKKNWNKKNGK